MIRSLIKSSIALAAAGAFLISATTAQAVSFIYSNATNDAIVFDGLGNFSFAPTTNNFTVDSGSAATFSGEITGTFAIGTVVPAGITSYANVTGTGAFIIHAPDGDFKATLEWLNIAQTGAGSTINVLGQVNLTNIDYAGNIADLAALRDATLGINVLTFNFTEVISLETLKTTQSSTSFSGRVTSAVPDGGLTLALLGMSMMGVESVRRRIKSA